MLSISLLFLTLLTFSISYVDIQNPSSLFLVKIALSFEKVNIAKMLNRNNNFISEISEEIGETLETLIINSKEEVYNKKQELENLSSLENYCNSFLTFLLKFFDRLIIILKKRKHKIINKKRKQRGLEEKIFDITNIQKKSIFLISIILIIAFSSINIWLTHIISSLYKKLKLISSLYAILCTANIISYTLLTTQVFLPFLRFRHVKYRSFVFFNN